MKKESKELGIRKACPVCKEPILVNGTFEAAAKFSLYCPHCYKNDVKTLVEFVVTKEIKVKLTYIDKTKIALVVILLMTGLILFGITKIKALQRINCDSFASQYEAQLMFNSNKFKYQSLDKNYNNVPCEDLIKK